MAGLGSCQTWERTPEFMSIEPTNRAENHGCNGAHQLANSDAASTSSQHCVRVPHRKPGAIAATDNKGREMHG